MLAIKLMAVRRSGRRSREFSTGFVDHWRGDEGGGITGERPSIRRL